ncbi:helix-hairpin-helix domain-containing protein [Paenibacillus selenitireducens]|uniref:DNA-binding protein n=1 Tax=Paenibacillus selenitireducens TaxID=1324314 RepID=UPI0018E93D56|nr:DNA-binding protein [Paenibacillus selenitireducens]
MEKETPSEPDFPKGIAKPALRALAGAGFVKLEQLSKITEADVLKLHGMGPKAMGIIRIALEEKGLSFADGEKTK